MSTTTSDFIEVPVVAGVVLERDGKFLLVQEKKPEVSGLWNLPAGKVDVGESIEQAAVREAKEESGFNIELVRKIDIYQSHATAAVAHIFESKIMGGGLVFPKDELLDAGWFSVKEITQMKGKLRCRWVLTAILEVAK